MMEFTGQLTLPSGLIASYHRVTSIKFILDREVVQLEIVSWGSESAYRNNYQSDRQLLTIPFTEINGIQGILNSLKNRLIAQGGPLAGTVEKVRKVNT